MKSKKTVLLLPFLVLLTSCGPTVIEHIDPGRTTSREEIDFTGTVIQKENGNFYFDYTDEDTVKESGLPHAEVFTEDKNYFPHDSEWKNALASLLGQQVIGHWNGMNMVDSGTYFAPGTIYADICWVKAL